MSIHEPAPIPDLFLQCPILISSLDALKYVLTEISRAKGMEPYRSLYPFTPVARSLKSETLHSAAKAIHLHTFARG